jgi:hypothetical protein
MTSDTDHDNLELPEDARLRAFALRQTAAFKTSEPRLTPLQITEVFHRWLAAPEPEIPLRRVALAAAVSLRKGIQTCESLLREADGFLSWLRAGSAQPEAPKPARKLKPVNSTSKPAGSGPEAA